jgi:diguanylate cyclase (GGDEF)-like protein/PAS domain S-box-containing protein
MTDITERKQVEDKLRESEERFRQFFDQSSEGISILNEDGCVVEWNPALEVITGLKQHQVIGKHFAEIQKGLSPQKFNTGILEQQKASVSSSLRTGQAPFLNKPIESQYQRADGNTRFVQQIAFLIKTQHGFQLGLLSQDITDRKLSEEKLRESEERFRTLVNSMDDIVYTLDTEQNHTGVYGSWVAKTGQTPEFYLGRSARDIFGSEASKFHERANQKALDGKVTVYEWSVDIEGGRLHYQTSVSPLRGPNGKIYGIVGLGRDITDRKHAEETVRQANENLQTHINEIEKLQKKLREQAIRDPLTKLFNRRYLQETLEREISRAKREKQHVSLIIMDIDHFKNVNDKYGHAAGDEMLRAISDLLKKNIRQEDIPCRYGGEEFLLVLPGASTKIAKIRANKLREEINALQVEHHGQNIDVTISLGIATFPVHGSTGEKTLLRADQALYRAKQDGRNRVLVFYDSHRASHPGE